MKRLISALCWLVLNSCHATTQDCPRTPDMPPGLKMEHYRSPTPNCVPNGITLNTTELQTLIQTQQPVLIDVFALLRRMDAGFGSTWLVNTPHISLPNAVWLPNVGYGQLETDIETWFQQQLQQLTQGNKTKPLVFFCVADCWMSWNAVQRAHSYGYSHVYWYKDGVDGWQAQGLPSIILEPTSLLVK
jgi:PQQ-dependent catabolism-associated CXXCW motif protein